MWTTVLPIHPGEDLRSFANRQTLVNSLLSTVVAREGSGKWATPAWGLPTGLRQFASRYGIQLQLPTAQDWMREHTLAPYYLTTVPAQRRAAFVERLLECRPGPRRPLLAIAAVEWFAPTAVLCPVCDDEHLARYGYSIVLRQWLVPFATRCAVHGELLQRFPNWTPAARGLGSAVDVLPLRRLQGLATTYVGQEMLRSGQNLLEELGCLLQSRGYVSVRGRIRRKELCTALIEYAKGRLEHLEFDTLFASHTSVARLISPLWNPKCCMHPAVAHMLLQALREAKEVGQAQLWSPARLNKRDDLLKAIECCSTLTEAAKLAGVTVTTAAIRARATGRQFAERPKKLDAKMRVRVEKLLRNGHGIAAVARHTGLSSVTVYRVLNANPELKACVHAEKRAKEVEDRRNAWLAQVQDNPSVLGKELRRIAAADYAFLYRWDRVWLSQHSPMRTKPRAPSGLGSTRSPPGASEQLKARIRQARVQDPMDLRARLTPTRLLTLAGRGAGSTSRHSAELKDALNQSSETLQAFVRRRLSAATARLHNTGQPLKAWAVVRESRLRTETIWRSGVSVEEVMASTRTFNISRRA
jgi:hypothetical protein